MAYPVHIYALFTVSTLLETRHPGLFLPLTAWVYGIFIQRAPEKSNVQYSAALHSFKVIRSSKLVKIESLYVDLL